MLRIFFDKYFALFQIGTPFGQTLKIAIFLSSLRIESDGRSSPGNTQIFAPTPTFFSLQFHLGEDRL